MYIKIYFTVLFATLLLFSCGQEGDLVEDNDNIKETLLLTTVSDSIYEGVTNDVMSYIGEKVKTRTTKLVTEIEAKKNCGAFI